MTTLKLPTPIDEAEMQMRRALRIGSSPHTGSRDAAEQRSPRRFAQTGDVPVTRLSSRKDASAGPTLAAAEEALQAERAAREQAEIALAQAHATITALQTKLAHAEMAHAEDMAAERHHREADQREYESRIVELTAHANSSPIAMVVEQRTQPAQPEAGNDQITDQAPVEWWVPGWKGHYRGR